MIFTSALFFAGTKSPLTTNQQTSSSGWVLPVSTTRKKNQTKWKQQLTMALGPDNVLGVEEIKTRSHA
jgi:hypothetical protein